ncbi:hypothetical protein O6H91_07G032500 [Diphasiastrum complanatum]|uniref:Uncharacterized protein n=3 Tax=Diphasiastrum complanatum TaxID=34168 RepID=A0ACC2D3Q5_DIPCM|nr:hypothetical protein O6H91_07G032500 [Diphasiastrum complanatum]KAJ7548910.1 hypothetical protein O6H91_07G032500 [Diphasiastrum complanatum]KAJ7548911.1 hypothetical protein O6H91_07G032500 [Diphasiastrum complanatum]
MSPECTKSAFFTKYAVNVSPLTHESHFLPNGNDSGFQEHLQHHDMMMPIPASNNAAEMNGGFAPFRTIPSPLYANLPLCNSQSLGSTVCQTGAFNTEPVFIWKGAAMALNAMGSQGIAHRQYMENSATLEGRICGFDNAYEWPSHPNATAGTYFQSQKHVNEEETIGFWQHQNGADGQDAEARASVWETGQIYGEYYTHLLEKFYSSYTGSSKDILGEDDMLVVNSSPICVPKSSNEMDQAVTSSTEMASRKKLKWSQRNSPTGVLTSGNGASTNYHQPATMVQAGNLGKPCKLKDLVRASKRNSLKGLDIGTLQSQGIVENRTWVPDFDALPSHSTTNQVQVAMAQKGDLKEHYSSRQSSITQTPSPVPYPCQHETFHFEGKLSKGITPAGSNLGQTDCDNYEGDRSLLVFSKRGRGRGVKRGTRRRNPNRDIYNGRRHNQDHKADHTIHKLDNAQNLPLVSTTNEHENLSLHFLHMFPKVQATPPRHQDGPTTDIDKLDKLHHQVAIPKDRICQHLHFPTAHPETSRPLRESDYVQVQYSQKGCTNLDEQSAKTVTPGLHSDDTAQFLRIAGDVKGGSTAFNIVQQMQQHATSSTSGGLRTSTEKPKAESTSILRHATTADSRGELLTSRLAGIRWAVATNRLPEKDEDNSESEDPVAQSSDWARERLKLTTQLMQNLVPPLPATMMQDSSVEGLICGIYTLARLSLGEACKMAHDSCNIKPPSSKKSEDNFSSSNRMDGDRKLKMFKDSKELPALIFMERVKERIKQLDKLLLRITGCTSILEMVMGADKLEKLKITNRLVKHHCKELFLDLNRIAPEADSRSVVQKSTLQKYVKAVRMPKKVPEGFECLTL